jgi:hypothetical protein
VGQSPLEVDYRILTAYAWKDAVTFDVETTTAQGGTGTQTFRADTRHTDPWVYGVRFKPLPGSKILVRTKVGGNTQLEETVELGVPVNQPQSKTFQPHASRIVRAINTTPIGCEKFTDDQDDPAAVIDTDQIGHILEVIWRRLDRGMDPAWLGPDGSRGLDLGEMNLSATARAEEEWARGFSEVATASRYGGPQSAWYFFNFPAENPKKPGDIDESDYGTFKRITTRRDNEGGRSWFPIGLACQQLDSLGLCLHNYPFADFSPGLNAGGSDSRPVFSAAKGGRWYAPGTTANTTAGAKDVRTPRGGLAAQPIPVGPGTVYEFYNTASKDGAHIGMLIRVHPDQDGWCGVQSIDTGALNVPGRTTSVNFNEGNFDDPWLLNDTNMPGPPGKKYHGVGVPYPNTPLSLATIRSWWPVGFARLILRRRAAPRQLLYATPMLRMHFGTKGFPMTLYGWSLRNRPYAAAVEASWQITIPQYGFARTVAESSPNDSMGTLLTSAGVNTTRDKPLTAKAGPSLYAFASIRVDNKNDRASRHADTGLGDGMAMPWGQRSRDAKAPKFPDFTTVPEYLRGDEPTPPPTPTP